MHHLVSPSCCTKLHLSIERTTIEQRFSLLFFSCRCRQSAFDNFAKVSNGKLTFIFIWFFAYISSRTASTICHFVFESVPFSTVPNAEKLTCSIFGVWNSEKWTELENSDLWHLPFRTAFTDISMSAVDQSVLEV